MRNIAWKIIIILSSIRLVPHILFMKWDPNKELIALDLERWSSLILKKKLNSASDHVCSFIRLMTFYPEYRSLFYYRLGWVGYMLSLLCRPMPTLYITADRIGPGLFIQHGYCTVIAAKAIGQNCWINQQVTIGFTNGADCPTIGDNVTIFAGAKVIGDVKIGNNSTVGANAVVVKNVPENCTVVGVPAYIVRKNGVKTKEPL